MLSWHTKKRTRGVCFVSRFAGISLLRLLTLIVCADNLFGDRVLNLGLFDDELYKAQTAWYVSHTEEYGVPLDSRHMWTKVSWTLCILQSSFLLLEEHQ